MRPIHIFIQNYKNATAGFSIWGKIILALVLSFIFLAVIFAFVGVIMDA